MNLNLETKISLQDFHRHVIATDVQCGGTAVLDELKQIAIEPGESLSKLLSQWVRVRCPREKHFQEDCWYATEVALDRCRCAHSEFRGYPVPKNERYVDFMPKQREAIESGSFPFSTEIRAAQWSEMPPPLVREREPWKYYILDGQQRVIRHWYHGVSIVRVFIYKGELEV